MYLPGKEDVRTCLRKDRCTYLPLVSKCTYLWTKKILHCQLIERCTCLWKGNILICLQNVLSPQANMYFLEKILKDGDGRKMYLLVEREHYY